MRNALGTELRQMVLFLFIGAAETRRFRRCDLLMIAVLKLPPQGHVRSIDVQDVGTDIPYPHWRHSRLGCAMNRSRILAVFLWRCVHSYISTEFRSCEKTVRILDLLMAQPSLECLQ